MSRVCVLKTPFQLISRGFRNISVIGAGIMGSGIAQVCMQNDFQVTLVDTTNSILARATARMHQSMLRIVRKQQAKEIGETSSQESRVNEWMTNLSTSTDVKTAVRDSDLIIEAVVEELEKKQNIFRMVDEVSSIDSVKVSNTSSLCLRDIGSVLEDPSRFGGLHFFQPVQVLPLVEVIRTRSTTDATFQALMHFTQALNKVPIACHDTPGFVVNRLLLPYLMDAVRMVERGDVTKRDMDLAMKLGAGHPMGPLELCDFIGLDTIRRICDSFCEQLPDDPVFLCPKLIHDLVDAGKLGKKTGQGFFTYDEKGNRIKD